MRGWPGFPRCGLSGLRLPGFRNIGPAGDSPVVPIFERGVRTGDLTGELGRCGGISLAYIEAGQWFNHTRQFCAGLPGLDCGGVRRCFTRRNSGTAPAGDQRSRDARRPLYRAPGSGAGVIMLVPLGPFRELAGPGGFGKTTLRYVPSG